MDRDILADAASQRIIEETFRWLDHETDETWLFLVGRINAQISAHPELIDEPIPVAITPDIYEHVTTRNGIEEWRVERLDSKHRDRPVLFAEWPNGKHVLIDGNHRVVRRYRDGLTDVDGYILPRSFWHPCYGWRL